MDSFAFASATTAITSTRCARRSTLLRAETLSFKANAPTVISFAVAQATTSMTSERPSLSFRAIFPTVISSEAEGRVEKSILFQKIRLIFSS